MSIKPLLENLTENWFAKTVCLVVACVLYIFYQWTSLDQRSISVPLTVLQDGEMICTTLLPSSVNVAIRTSPDNFASIPGTGITATLDLNYYVNEGTFEAPVHIDLPPEIKRLEPLQVTVSPERIRVDLEKNIFKMVKVVTNGVGEPAEGYEVTSYELSPQYVSVVGPRSIIDSLSYIRTEDILLDERSSNFTERKNILNTDRLITVLGDGKISVTTNIGYARGSRTIAEFPVYLSNLRPNLQVEETHFVDFTISGPQVTIDEYVPLADTVSADLSDITEPGEYEIPVRVLIPYEEYHLDTMSLDTIRVNVKER